jgi:hypothetical protein
MERRVGLMVSWDLGDRLEAEKERREARSAFWRRTLRIRIRVANNA